MQLARFRAPAAAASFAALALSALSARGWRTQSRRRSAGHQA
jgi:hypothetical protein